MPCGTTEPGSRSPRWTCPGWPRWPRRCWTRSADRVETYAMAELLWQPDPSRLSGSRMVAFRDWLRAERGLDFGSYESLWTWSRTDPPAFWGFAAGFLGGPSLPPAPAVLGRPRMPGASW